MATTFQKEVTWKERKQLYLFISSISENKIKTFANFEKTLYD